MTLPALVALVTGGLSFETFAIDTLTLDMMTVLFISKQRVIVITLLLQTVNRHHDLSIVFLADVFHHSLVFRQLLKARDQLSGDLLS